MTTEKDSMRRLIFNELTQLISEVKSNKKSKASNSNSNSKRSSKYGNTLSPQQLPSVVVSSPSTTRPKTSVLSQNTLHSSAKKSKTVEFPSLPSLLPTTQRAAYKTVKAYDDSSNSNPNLKWNGITPLEKMVESEVSKRLDKHLRAISEQTHKLYLDSREQIQSMTKQLHNALEQVNETKRKYEERSAELEKLIILLKNDTSDSSSQFHTNASSSSSQTITDTASVSFDSTHASVRTSRPISTSKASFNQARARSASAGAKRVKLNKRPMTAAINGNKAKTSKTRPELTKVSVYSNFNESRESPLSVAIAGLDQIMFEIESNVSIRRPIIKLWPKVSNFNVNRFNPEIVYIGNNSKKWIIACKLHPNSPIGPVPFVINYQSIDNNLVGNTVHNTTDETFCVVNTADEIIKVSKERRNSKSKKIKTHSKNFGNTFSSQKKSMYNSKSEKKLVKKSKLKTVRVVRDRTLPQTHHTNNKNNKHHAKKSKKHHSKRSKQRKYVINNDNNISQLSESNVKGKDYDNAMEQYANDVLNNEHHAEW